jgi:ABC-type transport system involved in multi-copper enzyme maturation permease subunit
MLRIALVDILLFALPFVLYAAYMVGVKGRATSSLWRGAPVFWLLAAGCGLLLVVMATLIQFSGGKPGGTYRPPVIENGVVKPGEID